MRGNADGSVKVRGRSGTDRPDYLKPRVFFPLGSPIYDCGRGGARQGQHNFQKKDAEQEAADMRPPCHAAGLAGAAGGADKLQDEPDSEKIKGRNFQKIGNKKNWDEG